MVYFLEMAAFLTALWLKLEVSIRCFVPFVAGVMLHMKTLLVYPESLPCSSASLLLMGCRRTAMHKEIKTLAVKNEERIGSGSKLG